MDKEKLLNTIYKLYSTVNTVLATEKGTERLLLVMNEFGFTEERLNKILTFVESNMTEEDFDNNMEKMTYHSYIECLRELEGYMKVADGYKEMGDINLSISQDFFHLEEEGIKANEMVSKEGENSTKTK